jgi:serine/threonine-protein kinase
VADVTPDIPTRRSPGNLNPALGDNARADATAKRLAADAADASLLRDRVTAAFGDQYFIGDEVGRGGMAVVYAAEDVRLQRHVALKVLPPDLAFRSDVRERFVREAQTAARLNHPNIVPIYAVHEQAGMVCFAMSLVTGESVAALIGRDMHPAPERIAAILEQVADALAYAHASGVVHRDIKPDNILLDRESGRALVTDFGIARAAESGSRLTQTGIAVGTPAFMSPEQATGEKDVDGRSDVYSLGVVGYLLLSGRLPFQAASTPAMLLAHVSETPPSIASLRPDAPRALVEILERALAKRPADRWESAMAMRDALRRVQRDGSLQAPNPARPTTAPSYAAASQTASAAAQYARDLAAQEVERAKRAARDYTDRHGHRAEDWSPRNVGQLGQANAPLQPMAPPVPLVPHLPPLSPNASREEFREWRRAVKEQRRDARDRMKQEIRQGIVVGISAGLSASDAVNLSRPLPVQISRFRRSVVSSGATILFLGAINAITSRQFPWAIFPAFGISMGLLAQWGQLRDQGVRWSQIFGDESARDALDVTPQAPLTKPQLIARAVSSFKRRLTWMAGSAAVALGSAALGAALHGGGRLLVLPFAAALFTGALASVGSIVAASRLRALGVPLSSAFDDEWKQIAAVADDRPRDVRLRELLSQVAGDTVLLSSYGDAVRSAVDDRLTIKESSSKLTDADKAMVPDVEPTADALLERIGALASGLERLQRDLPVDALTQLESRIASVEAEAESAPDRERRLMLLTRQRDSLRELVDRRDTMARQLESATLAMRSLRLDMMKLRTLGVGAAIGDVTNATQEARALSRDIGRAVEAADEVRRL